jgi:hypothetical protein
MATTTAEKIAQLEEFLASGATSMEYEGRKITRPDVPQLLQALRYFQEKAAAESNQPRGRSTFVWDYS